MNIPNFPTLPTSEFFFWVLLVMITSLSGLAVYFIKRYIDKQDKHNVETSSKIEDHAKQMTDVSARLEMTATMMKYTADEIRESQHKLNEKFFSLEAKANSIEGAVDRITSKTIEATVKIDEFSKSIFMHEEQISRNRRRIDDLREARR